MQGLWYSLWRVGCFLVAAGSISSCGLWDLVPWPGIEPRPPTLRAWSLSPWTTRGVPESPLLIAVGVTWICRWDKMTQRYKHTVPMSVFWFWSCAMVMEDIIVGEEGGIWIKGTRPSLYFFFFFYNFLWLCNDLKIKTKLHSPKQWALVLHGIAAERSVVKFSHWCFYSAPSSHTREFIRPEWDSCLGQIQASGWFSFPT